MPLSLFQPAASRISFFSPNRNTRKSRQDQINRYSFTTARTDITGISVLLRTIYRGRRGFGTNVSAVSQGRADAATTLDCTDLGRVSDAFEQSRRFGTTG